MLYAADNSCVGYDIDAESGLRKKVNSDEYKPLTHCVCAVQWNVLGVPGESIRRRGTSVLTKLVYRLPISASRLNASLVYSLASPDVWLSLQVNVAFKA